VGNKRPDLRRDCDAVLIIGNAKCMVRETNDLIYEGIATRAVKFCFDSAGVLKQTT